jgi:uncharacterized BrkB/YihY/UPF0761 family membrane protein
VTDALVALRSARAAAGDFIRRVYIKADQDKIFFMAGAIAFNILVAIVPLALAAIGITGMILQQRYQAEAGRRLVEAFLQALPPVSDAFTTGVADTLGSLVAKSGGFTTVGIVVFVWLATRLVGTLRTVLREVFDINQDRNIIAGKLFDMEMVVVAGTLLSLNVGLTSRSISWPSSRGRARMPHGCARTSPLIITPLALGDVPAHLLAICPSAASRRTADASFAAIFEVPSRRLPGT